MMKKVAMILVLGLLAICLGCGNSLVGKWQIEDSETTLELQSGGKAILATAYSEIEMTYRVKGDTIHFKDAAGAESSVTYKLDGKTLTVYDYNDNPTVYVKVD